MKSFSILKTNTGLTTNIKIMVDSKYGMYLESIDSTSELSSSKYKKVSFNKDNYFDELIPFFYQKMPIDIAFSIKYDHDNNNMSSNFSKQYDDTYQMGARNITNNKNYTEEFECFAPLYVSKSGLPNGYVIFRVDGPGLLSLTKDNFKSEIINNFKCIKIFDLSKKTPIGEWLDKNFISNQSYPATPFEIDFKRLEFSKWNGINYDNGGYTYKSFFLDETLEKANPLFDLDKFVFDGFKNNKVVFPHIINLSFLFDDTPATPFSLKKWSINRYFGFYIDDMEIYDSVTPNILHRLKDDVVVASGNKLLSLSDTEGSPFIEEWKDNIIYYVEYKGNFYKVEKYKETLSPKVTPINALGGNRRVLTEEITQRQVVRYRIISDIDLTGKESELNSKIIYIDESNALVKLDLTYYQIDGFDNADIWVIEIDNMYHNLVRDGDKIKVNTDYAFNFLPDKYEYWINSVDPSYKKTVDLIINSNNTPKVFRIYRLKLTDIKDFDTSIIDTEYSKFEYENKEDLTLTDETKMYTVDLRSTSNPKDLNDYNFKDKVVNIPVSSEYTADYETFRIVNNDLNELWRKNATYCRWVYQDSLSANDWPYLMNNSTLFEDFNRSVNPFDPDPKRIERNLDYFYTINAGTTSYINHTLHIENNINGVQDTSFKFEVDKYLNLGTCSTGTYSYDYFSYFFNKKSTFDNGNIIKKSNKYSLFNIGDNIIPNTTVFKGLKFRIYDVETIKSNQGVIENINLKNSNSFENYKFSILLSNNDMNFNGMGITSSINNMQWNVIENWEMDKNYGSGSIVLLDDILYQSLQDTMTTVPERTIGGVQVKATPYNDPHWTTYTYAYGVVNSAEKACPFWNPIIENNAFYNVNDIVYNNGEYYYRSPNLGTASFWNPGATYSTGDFVLYKGIYYKSTINYNKYPPNSGIKYRSANKWEDNWEKADRIESLIIAENAKWITIELWNPSINYNNQYVVHNNIVYNGSGSAAEEPGISSGWIRIYSINQDTNYVYGTSSNPFIEMNNRIYLINSNSTNSTLENGINIYINKKWENILINIFINDNTITGLSFADRDILYTDLSKKLTANNFINCINDISNKFGFSDFLNYIIIEKNGVIKKFNIENISDLKNIIFCETPDELFTKIDSVISIPITVNKSVINVTNLLKDGKINNLSELNYYNDIPFGVDISFNKKDPNIVKTYHGMKNITENQIYRHSGYYMPLFYNIDLFESPGITSSFLGNYKFDTSYTNFGKIKQRVISKINRKDNILKLKDNKSYHSIYPMIDEFGYTQTDFFMFKSTWDYEYHIECIKNEEIRVKDLRNDIQTSSIPQIVNTNTNLRL
jgi:hypothetical protein